MDCPHGVNFTTNERMWASNVLLKTKDDIYSRYCTMGFYPITFICTIPMFNTQLKNIMQSIDLNLLKELTAVKGQPCISLYMETHRQHPESEVDHIAFKKLYRKTMAYIEEHNLTTHQPLLEPLEKLIDDKSFWDNGTEGLALFCSLGETKVLRLPKTVEEISCVANSFCVKPLFRFINENQGYYLLALGMDSVKLYAGDKYHLEEMDIHNKVPLSMKEALGHELTDNHQHASVVLGTGLHGYMEKSQEEEIDLDRFFRRVLDAVQEHSPSSRERPLYVATLPEHQKAFQQMNKGQYVQPLSFGANPHALSRDELLHKIQEVIMVNFEERKDMLLEKAQQAAQENLSSLELSDVVRGALDGKIDVLFIENDRTIKGSIDADNREIQQGRVLGTDVINELSCLVFEQGGRVMVVDKEEMRSETGVFTINRY